MSRSPEGDGPSGGRVAEATWVTPVSVEGWDGLGLQPHGDRGGTRMAAALYANEAQFQANPWW